MSARRLYDIKYERTAASKSVSNTPNKQKQTFCLFGVFDTDLLAVLSCSILSYKRQAPMVINNKNNNSYYY